jgi:hypothetical protein
VLDGTPIPDRMRPQNNRQVRPITQRGGLANLALGLIERRTACGNRVPDNPWHAR